jgi:cytochrome c-type biogenesis protein CcmH
MVQTMVQGLTDRLLSDGGTAADWAQLITAYGVMGQVDQANDIATKAKSIFANDSMDLAMIITAIKEAGLSE